MKKTKERAATEAEVDTGKISLFGTFSQSCHGSSSNPPSTPTRCNSGGNRHEVDDDDDDEEEDTDEDAGNGGGGGGEAGDTVMEAREGRARGGTSGGNKQVIT